MKINEVSKITNLSVDTIRYYEKVGLIKPKRSTGNYRVFAREDMKQLTLIKNLKMMGLTINEMISIFNLMNRETSLSCNLASVSLLEEKIAHVEKEIEERQRILNVCKELFHLVNDNKFAENEKQVYQTLLSLKEELEK